MTYLETPAFGMSELIDGTKLHELITIPKKYKKKYSYIQILIGVIIVIACSVISNQCSNSTVSEYYTKAIFVIIGTVIFTIGLSQLVFIKNKNIQIAMTLLLFIISIVSMIATFYLFNSLKLENKLLDEELLYIIIILFLYFIGYHLNILPVIFIIQLIYNLVALMDEKKHYIYYKDSLELLGLVLMIVMILSNIFFLTFYVFKLSEIYKNIVFFAERQKTSNEPELTKSRVIILADALNKYIKYSEDNKLKVELIHNEQFIEFLKNIYLKNDSESAENKKVIEHFLDNINRSFIE